DLPLSRPDSEIDSQHPRIPALLIRLRFNLTNQIAIIPHESLRRPVRWSTYACVSLCFSEQRKCARFPIRLGLRRIAERLAGGIVGPQSRKAIEPKTAVAQRLQNHF